MLISSQNNVFLATLPFYETLGLNVQLGLEDVPDLPANFSFYTGSKGVLVTFRGLCSYLDNYNVGHTNYNSLTKEHK